MIVFYSNDRKLLHALKTMLFYVCVFVFNNFHQLSSCFARVLRVSLPFQKLFPEVYLFFLLKVTFFAGIEF